MRTIKGYLKVLKKNDLSSNRFRLNEILVRINENIKVSYFFYFFFYCLWKENGRSLKWTRAALQELSQLRKAEITSA